MAPDHSTGAVAAGLGRAAAEPDVGVVVVRMSPAEGNESLDKAVERSWGGSWTKKLGQERGMAAEERVHDQGATEAEHARSQREAAESPRKLGSCDGLDMVVQRIHSV